jgi:hypothetical protein
MKKIKIIAGIIWAFLSLVLILVLFPGLNSFSSSVSKLPFMKINPNYTGGEIDNQIVTERCTLDIRKPVFNGLLGERHSGFVQLDWRGDVPEIINDSIDYNCDGKMDFGILVNRKDSKTDLKSFNSRVTNVLISTPTSYGWAIRVGLLKE